MILDSPIISGSSTVTGNLTVLGTLTASVSGSVTSASYATNAETLDGLDSTSFTSTSSFTAYTASTNASILSNVQNIAILYVSSSLLDSRVTRTEATASSLTTASGSFSTRVTSNEGSITSLTQNVASLFATSASLNSRVNNLDSYTSSLNSKTGSFATTGSNNFNGNQAITGSLTTTGQIIAQTLNVQQVTSSIVYSSGSNIFGNSVSNTQQFTGSLQVSGSNHYVLGNVGVGTTTINNKLEVDGNINVQANQFFRYNGDTGLIGSGTSITGGTNTQLGIRAANDILFATNGANERMRLNSSGNLSIGNTNDSFKLDVTGEGRFYQSATSSTAYLRVENNRSRNAAVRLTTTLGDYYLGVGIGADVNQFQLFDGNAGETRLTIASTGAATFFGKTNISKAISDYAFTITNTDSDGYGMYIQAGSTNNAIDVYNAAGTTQLFKLTGAGAATFSSTVAVTTTGTTAALQVNLPANGDATILSSFGSNSAFGWYLRQDEVTTGDWRIFRRQVNVDYQVLNLSRGSGAATFASSVAATTGVFSISAGNPLQVYQTSATNSTTATIRQTGAGGNGNQDIGLIVDIQGANDVDRIANFRYYDGSTYASRFLVQRNGFVGIQSEGYSVSNTLSLGRVFGFVQDINSGYIQANMANSGNYIVSQYAVRMHLDSALGEITFLNAPSGTAGNAVSLTSVLKITASGNVGIGTTSPSQKLEVVGGEIKAGRVDSSSEGGQVSFARASDNATAWYIDAYGSTSSPSLRFVNVSDSSVVMSVTGSTVLVGTTTNSTLLGSYTKLKVSGDGSANAGASFGSAFLAAGSSGYDTGISVNMGTSGATMLLLASINTSVGTSTNAAVYIIRFYFSGNNAPTTSYIGGSSDFVTFSVSGTNTLILTGSSSGNKSYSWWINKVDS